MRTYIKKLQAKPENKRKQIFVGAMTVCMSFVLFIWVSTIGSKFSAEKIAKVQEDIKPFALFSQTISDTVGGITASVGNAKIPTIEESKVEQPIETRKVIDLIPVETQ